MSRIKRWTYVAYATHWAVEMDENWDEDATYKAAASFKCSYQEKTGIVTNSTGQEIAYTSVIKTEYAEIKENDLIAIGKHSDKSIGRMVKGVGRILDLFYQEKDDFVIYL